MNKLSIIREQEIARRKKGKKTNINTPTMQDLRWRSYGKGRKNLMPAMIEMYDYIVNKVPFPTGNILDVGVGEGEIIWRLDKANKGLELWGVDISPLRIFWNIQKVKDNLTKINIRFLVCNAENLVFDDDYFGCAISTATIEHLTNPRKAISEMMRVLKVGGVAFLGIPIESNPNQPIHSPDHYNFYKKESEILELFKGLNVVSTKLIKPNFIVEIVK